MRNFTNVSDLSTEAIHNLIESAIQYKHGLIHKQYPHVSVANMFFENSTRTKHSFEMAEHKLGMHTINFDVATSSVTKGESLYDSVLTLQALGVRIAVIRHFEDDYYKALESMDVAIINAGSGCGEHPSQSMLDMMTIYDEFKGFNDLKVAIIGDLSHSRVATSNMIILNKLGAKVQFSGPAKYFDDRFSAYGTFVGIDQAIADNDVVMMLRVQLERHTCGEELDAADYHQRYGLTLARYQTMKDRAVLMHPAPVNRDVELATELVECAKSRIVAQMKNGVYMRMAILDRIVEGRQL